MTTLSKKQNIGNREKFYRIEEIGAYNQFFTKVKIYIMHEGQNRNGSNIYREAIDKAIPSLFNIPIIGNYLEEEKNFSDHAMKLERNEKNEKVLVSETVPYGVVPESASVYWEKVTEDNGEEKEYLVVDGALLWTGRYSQLLSIYDEGYFNQSMEIYMDEYSYRVSGSKEVLDIHAFTFTGLCLLGVSKESDIFGHEEPAFKQGKVMTYSLEGENFTNQFKEMVREMQYNLNEGDEEMAQSITHTEEGITIEADEITIVEEPTQVFEEQPVVVEEEVAVVEETPTEETPVVVEETPAEEIPTVVEEDNSLDELFTLKENFETLTVSYSALEAELFQLREYKRERELGDLRFKFEGQVSEAELNELFTANKDVSINSLELEIFALIGKTNFSLNSTATKNKEVNTASILSPKQEEKQYNPYGDIKFLK